jgi:hypothetical protein
VAILFDLKQGDKMKGIQDKDVARLHRFFTTAMKLTAPSFNRNENSANQPNSTQ